jgi:hypothetical protein
MASRRPPRPLPASPTSMRPYLSSHTSSCASLCTRNTPTHATEPQFPCAASGPRRRRASAAVGEESPPPPPFSSLWVHQGLTKLNWLQIHVLEARGRRASSTPERRPSCRRCQAPPPLDPFRLRARPLHRRTVSINPHPISLPFRHSSVPASSPEQPRRPLSVPAAGEAQSPPLTPRSRAHGPPLHFSLARGRRGGRERRPWPTPASSRRAPPLSGAAAAALACTRPGPSDLAWTAQITYPFGLCGRSTVDPCTGRTARSTGRARIGSR